jgi:predicted transcriptional regulator
MDEAILGLTARIVVSYAGNNSIARDQLPALIKAVHQSLATADVAPIAAAKPEPVVEVRKSVFGDHLICLACGASYKTLRRHLGSEHQLTPEEYRTRYELPRTYPVVAPDYAKRRSAMAKEFGLGRGSSRGRKRKGRGKRG